MSKAILTDGKNTVEFNVVKSESPGRRNVITDNPVETGADVIDHIRTRPVSFSLTGVVMGKDAAQKLYILDGFRNNGSLLRYVGRNALFNYAIESFESTHDVNVRNGFAFNITLKQVRIVHKKTVDIIMPSIPQSQIKQLENKGRQQPKIKSVDLEKELALTGKVSSKVG